MEVELRTIAITIPQEDTSLLRKLSGKMGWQIVSLSARSKSSVEKEDVSLAKRRTLKAIADVRKGKNVTSCASFEEYLKAVEQ